MPPAFNKAASQEAMGILTGVSTDERIKSGARSVVDNADLDLNNQLCLYAAIVDYYVQKHKIAIQDMAQKTAERLGFVEKDRADPVKSRIDPVIRAMATMVGLASDNDTIEAIKAQLSAMEDFQDKINKAKTPEDATKALDELKKAGGDITAALVHSMDSDFYDNLVEHALSTQDYRQSLSQHLKTIANLENEESWSYKHTTSTGDGKTTETYTATIGEKKYQANSLMDLKKKLAKSHLDQQRMAMGLGQVKVSRVASMQQEIAGREKSAQERLLAFKDSPQIAQGQPDPSKQKSAIDAPKPQTPPG
ncbi:MAG: hypothetical protein VXY77_00420 [Pseudomonadota bacterium]|nr:hypothetical protein [Pseudomonadota bacterium]